MLLLMVDDVVDVPVGIPTLVRGGAAGGRQQTYRGGGSVGVVPPCRRWLNDGKALGSLAEMP
jgi:hypothetical protein